MQNKAPALRDFLQFLDQDRLQMATLIAQEFLPRFQSPLGLIRAKAEALQGASEGWQKENALNILDQVEQMEKILITLDQFLTVPDLEENFCIYQGVEDLKHFFQRRIGKGKIQVLNMVPPELEVPLQLQKIRPFLMSMFIHAMETLEFSSQEPRCFFIQYRKLGDRHILSFEVNGMASDSSLNLLLCKSLAESAGWDLKSFSRNSRLEVYIPSSSSGPVVKPYSRSLR